MADVGYTNAMCMGENIAGMGWFTPGEEVLQAFKNSWAHDETQLNDNYNVVGISQVLADGGTAYWTVDFGDWVDSSAWSLGNYKYADQRNPRIVELGSWNTNWTSAATDSSIDNSNQTGAGMMISFTGTSVDVIGKTTAYYGKAEVSLDGGDWETVDFYSAEETWRVPVYSKEDLDYGSHTLLIKVAGEKNPSSDGYRVAIDGVSVFSPDGYPASIDQAEAPTVIQEDDPNLNYSENWNYVDPNVNPNYYASGNGLKNIDAPGSVQVEFDGTYLAWNGKVGNTRGKAWVILDGGDPELVDLYRPYNSYQQKIWSTGLLVDEHHTVTITWTGLRCSYAYASNIGVDWFDVIGQMAPASDPPLLTRYEEDTEWGITYEGEWTDAFNWYNSGNTYKSINTPGPGAVEVDFNGTFIVWLSNKGPWYGKARVSVDGGDWEEVDLWYQRHQRTKAAWNSGMLAPGDHTLRIEWLNEKRWNSWSYVVTVDCFDIVGTLNTH